MSAISVQHVSRLWGATRAVDDVSFEAPAGTMLVLLGPSGCGKSTTLRLIAGLEQVSGGRILIGGLDVTSLPPAQWKLSMVFQSYALFPHLSGAENIVFGLRVRLVPSADRSERLNRTLLVTMILPAQYILCTLADYAFARFAFRGCEIATLLVLLQLMIMPEVLIVKSYRIRSRLDLRGTLTGIDLPAIASAFGSSSRTRPSRPC